MSLEATPILRRRGKDLQSSSNAMDIQAIRGRRNKLENILQSRRPLPLSRGLTSLSHPALSVPGDALGPAAGASWLHRRRHSIDVHRVFTDPYALQPIPAFTSMSPYSKPLPGISKRREITDDEPSSPKTRQTQSNPESRDTECEETNTEDLHYSLETLQEIVNGINNSSSHDLCLRSTVRARKLLSLEEAPPIEGFLQAGILKPLLPLLQQEEDTKLLFEATWVVTNLAAGTSQQTATVVEEGLVPILIRLLGNEMSNVREQAAWALGNIAGDGQKYRNLLLREGILMPLLDTLRDVLRIPVSLVRVSTWVLSNLLRYKEYKMTPEERTVCVTIINSLLTFPDNEVNIDALWAASYIADADEQGLQSVVSAPGMVNAMVQHLASDDKLRMVPALRVTGSIAASNDEHTETVLEAGVVPIYAYLLKTGQHNTKKEAAWALSNITAGNHSQIQRVIDDGVLQVLLHALLETSDVRREATWALCNLTTGGLAEQVKALVDAGGVPFLLMVMAGGEVSTISVALNTLDNILKTEVVKEEAKEQVISGKGVELLKELEQCASKDLHLKAEYILEAYFQQEEPSDKEDDKDDVPEEEPSAS
nr:uncharacterized protein LOC128692941 isoform X1 [Cherax quadricarinatus]